MPGILWSAPGVEQGVTPGAANARYEVNAPSIHGVLSSILSERERQRAAQQEAIAQAAKAVSGIMNQRRQDQIAQAMLDQASGYDNQSPSQSEGMARALNEGNLRPADAWTAYTTGKAAQFKDAAASIQQQKLDLMAEKLSQNGLVDVTLPTGESVKVPAMDAFRYYYEGKRGPSAVEKSVAPYGLSGSDVGLLDFTTPNAIQFRDNTGKQISTDEAEAAPSTSVATGMVGDKAFSMPYTKFRQVRGLSTGSAQATGGASNDPYAKARDAIERGADPEAVKKRLKDAGYDPSLL